MRYAGTERDDDGPWFTLGQLEVTTTVLVLLAWTAGLVLWAAEGPAHAITSQLVLRTDSVALGEVWRVFTYPVSHVSFGLWDLINAAIFWFIGTDLERATGRRSYAALLGTSVIAIGLSATLFGTVLGRPTVLWDIDLLTLAVVLIYCLEHPLRPFFFGIPAWVIAAVIAAIELVNDLANRDWARFLGILLASGIIAVAAKRAGLFSAYDRIPELRFSRPGGGSERASKPKKAAKPSKSGGGLSGRFRRSEEAEIVAMPTQPTRPRPAPVVPDDVSADDLALDALLDKISATGIDSLTDAERRQLDEIRERRRHD